jgi:hypothetical protein
MSIAASCATFASGARVNRSKRQRKGAKAMALEINAQFNKFFEFALRVRVK